MNKYYIPELNLNQIKKNINLCKDLENKYYMTSSNNHIILTIDGFYKFEKNKLIKYKIISKDTSIKENFIDNLTLIGINYYHKKICEIYHIPYEHSYIIINQLKFSIGENGQHFLVIEKILDKINDLYFLSPKKINENDIFFLNDISSFIKTLNV
tara:strand:- start:34 stop:498 length:465 start_codon:yes stop_codon:yes gene_type:complete